MDCSRLLSHYSVESHSCNKDDTAHKPKVYTTWPFTEDDCGLQGQLICIQILVLVLIKCVTMNKVLTFFVSLFAQL